jgi:hypothetical protein
MSARSRTRSRIRPETDIARARARTGAQIADTVVRLLRVQMRRGTRQGVLCADMRLRDLRLDPVDLVAFALSVEDELGIDGETLDRRLRTSCTIQDVVDVCALLATRTARLLTSTTPGRP